MTRELHDAICGRQSVFLCLFWALSLGGSCSEAPHRAPSTMQMTPDRVLPEIGATEEGRPEWLVEAVSALHDLELAWDPRLVSEVEASRSLPGTEVPLKEPASIGTALWKLWRATGYCAFARVERRRLYASVPGLVESYRAYIYANRDCQESELRSRGIRQALDILEGPYWESAFYYLTEALRVDGLCLSTEPLCSSLADRKELARIRAGLTAWYEEHRKDFVWEPPPFRCFTPTRSLSVPKEFEELKALVFRFPE